MSRIDTELINVMLALTSCPGGSQEGAGDHGEEPGSDGAEAEEPACTRQGSGTDQDAHDEARRTED